jgi:aldose 1-epimerase
LGRFAIHGEVWRNPWTITQQSDLRLDLACAPGRDGAWPWDYVCTQSIVIAENGLEMTLSLQSNSDAPFPYTFGLHPYFARRGENRLSARVQHRAILSPEGMPLGEEDGSARWRDETVTRGVEDHCYRGWTGEAVVAFIDDRFQVRMRAEGCDFLQVYAPDADYFCVEPQTGGPNALNRGLDGGVRILDPRGRATIVVCFTPEAF